MFLYECEKNNNSQFSTNTTHIYNIVQNIISPYFFAIRPPLNYLIHIYSLNLLIHKFVFK